MNSTAEKVARKEWERVTEPDKVRVKVKVTWWNGMCLPDEEGKDIEEAVFSVLTFGDNHVIEKAVAYEEDVGNGRTTVKVLELNEYKRLIVKKNLLSWTLDIPIERDEQGWMRPKCYERVSSIPAPLMEAFLDGYEESIAITDAEERKIDRQSAILFSPSGHGVVDACEAVSLFCTLGNFWEKFGLDKNKLPTVPYREYLLMKIMMGKEGDSMRVKTHSKASTTMIAGAHGSRPSRGISIPM